MIDEQASCILDKQTPSPITRADILNILHYICPPSTLHPVPPHLLSLPLLQRHHFLNISPDDPTNYLTWPSAQAADTVLLLLECINPDDLPSLLATHDIESTHPDIHYTADPEAVYAHVRITPTAVLPSPHPDTWISLRLIFLWDQPSRSWRYHNSAIGSFPENSQSDLSHAMALFQSPDDFLAERTYAFNAGNLDDEVDAYWNTYNAMGDDPASSGLSAEPPTVADTEDAYWAQYSTVQGSADSTIPSPRLLDRKLLQPQQPEVDQRIFVPSSELNPDFPNTETYNPLAPPSPSSLTRRLASLPIRPHSSPPLQDDEPPSASASSPSPQSPHADLAEEFVSGLASDTDKTCSENTAADEALKHAIRGLYRLWNTSARSQKDFLAVVQQAIDE